MATLENIRRCSMRRCSRDLERLYLGLAEPAMNRPGRLQNCRFRGSEAGGYSRLQCQEASGGSGDSECKKARTSSQPKRNEIRGRLAFTHCRPVTGFDACRLEGWSPMRRQLRISKFIPSMPVHAPLFAKRHTSVPEECLHAQGTGNRPRPAPR